MGVFTQDFDREYKKRHGWAFYQDSEYTSDNKLSINNSIEQITINGLGSNTVKDYLPIGVDDFWKDNAFAPTSIGDSWQFRLDFECSSNSSSNQFDVTLDIGDGSPSIVIIDETKLFRKSGDSQYYSIDLNLYTLDTFVENGGRLYIETGDDLHFWNFGLFIKRDYSV
jgi:hypothetical protein